MIREKKGKKTPAPKETPADFSAYDTVFIGFPVWAATIPDFLQEYIRQADLAGKRVIPFATAGNNGRDESLAARYEVQKSVSYGRARITLLRPAVSEV